MIQSIPTYPMGIYKFPDSVIKEISSAMARFFWGRRVTQRKIHWKSWNVMCTSKPFRGMKFRSSGI